jgi:RHS repeat-associated protein
MHNSFDHCCQARKHYNYFRDYDPGIGRYTESDPIGLKGGLNTFGYVGSRPLNLTDEKGDVAAAAAVPFLGGGGAAAALGTLGALGAAGAVGVGIGNAINWGVDWAFGTSIGSALYDALNKSCFVETCTLQTELSGPGGTMCVYKCTLSGQRKTWLRGKQSCKYSIYPNEGTP